jgi:hypothetical protein
MHLSREMAVMDAMSLWIAVCKKPRVAKFP